MSNKPYFFLIKPTLENGKKPVLDINRTIVNTNTDVTTSIMLDTNIVIHIEKVVKGGNTERLVRDKNLMKLVSFLRHGGKIAVTAGAGIMEMPPARRRFAEYCFDEFTKAHASNMTYDPKGWNDVPPDSNIDTWEYEQLEEDRQLFYALPYGTFMLMLIANEQALTPEKKFEYFTKRLVDEFDLILSQISEIAKLCFYNPTSKEEPAFKSLLKAAKDNYLNKKPPKHEKHLSSAQRIKRACLNSAADLYILTSALASDLYGVDGEKQDTWVATGDKKLAAFAQYFSYTDLSDMTGSIAEVPRHEDQLKSDYWKSVDEYSQSLSEKRRERIFSEESQIDPERYVAAVRKLHDEIRS